MRHAVDLVGASPAGGLETKLAKLAALGLPTQTGGLSSGEQLPDRASGAQGVVSLGIAAFDRVLPEGGFPRGAVTELQVHGLQGGTTSLALLACRAAQQCSSLLKQTTHQLSSSGMSRRSEGAGELAVPRVDRQSEALVSEASIGSLEKPDREAAQQVEARRAAKRVRVDSFVGEEASFRAQANWGSGIPSARPAPHGLSKSAPLGSGWQAASQVGGGWCAFVDPAASLYAPAVHHWGVDLDRLLVVRPTIEALARVALKIAEARVVSVLVIDTVGTGESLAILDSTWQRSVRRLALAVRGSSVCVLLTTHAAQRYSMPLPVALRLEVGRPCPKTLLLRVAKERFGRVTNTLCLAWPELSPVAQSPSSTVDSIDLNSDYSIESA